jgi:hypothetical protein
VDITITVRVTNDFSVHLQQCLQECERPTDVVNVPQTTTLYRMLMQWKKKFIEHTLQALLLCQRG